MKFYADYWSVMSDRKLGRIIIEAENLVDAEQQANEKIGGVLYVGAVYEADEAGVPE